MTARPVALDYAPTSMAPECAYLPWPEPPGFESLVIRLWRERVENHAVAEGAP